MSDSIQRTSVGEFPISQTVTVPASASLVFVSGTLPDPIYPRHLRVGAEETDGKLDFAGLQRGYTQFFGTPEQPNKPARTALQVVALPLPGALVEVEAIAARAV